MPFTDEKGVPIGGKEIPRDSSAIDERIRIFGGNESLSKPMFTEKSKQPVILTDPTRFPVHLFPPKNAQYFDVYARQITVSGVDTELVRYTVPQGFEGWLKFFGQDVGVITDWNSFTWKVLTNGTTLVFYGNITRQLGTITEMTETLRYINEYDVITMTALQTSGGVMTAWGRIKGWVYPIERY